MTGRMHPNRADLTVADVFDQHGNVVTIDELPDDDLRWVIFKVLRDADVTNEVLGAIRSHPTVALAHLGVEPFGWECTEAGDRSIWSDLDKWHAIELNGGEDDGKWHRLYRRHEKF